MLTKGIKFINFKKKKINSNLKKKLNNILKENNQIILSLGKNYKYSFKKKNLKKYKKNSDYRVIGMGGSSLGARAIYDFLKNKIKKNFIFIDNLGSNFLKEKKKYTNLIISKSGNTLETIINSNVVISRGDKNIFITENKNNYLSLYAKKLKGDIIHHNNFIGGRYSVMSEVGMVPAELMGLDPNKFKIFNNLIKNKIFFNNLISNVNSILYFSKKKNSIL